MRWLAVVAALGVGAVAVAAPGLSRMPDAEVPVPPLPQDAPEDVVRGAHLYRIAACVGCHSPPFDDAEHLGGGRDLPTAFGTFYAPNIGPDPDVGIGTWTYDDFERALHRGVAPDGHRYWPAFPYMAYTGLSDGDVADLWAYLRSQPPVTTPERPHEIRPAYRGKLWMWRALAFHEGRLVHDPDESDAWNRGRYLVHAAGYCDQCHTPRTALGTLVRRHLLAGGANPGKGEVHPNLTPDVEHGLGRWSEDDIVTFLLEGRKPGPGAAPAPNPEVEQDRRLAGESQPKASEGGARSAASMGPTAPGNLIVADPDQVMAEKIHDSFAYLGDADARAIAVYLRSLPPDPYDPFAVAARRLR